MLKSSDRDPIRCAILYLYSLDSFIYNVLNGIEFDKDFKGDEVLNLDELNDEL